MRGWLKGLTVGVTVTGAVLVEGDGEELEPIIFGYQGVVYRVELDACDRQALDEMFSRHIALAQRVGNCGLEEESATH